MIVTKKFSFDLETRGISPLMYAVQGDVNTRKIEISLFSNGTAWEIPDGTVVAVAYRKPDGTGGLYDELPSGESASAVSGNVVTVMLAPQVLTCAGNVVASVVFYSQDMVDTLATFPFKIHVEKNPGAGQQISNNYYALQNLEQVNAAYNDLLERMDALEQGAGLVLYVGAVRPTDGTLYWLDTSDSGGVAEKYSVTTNLSNSAIDNTAKTVTEGESYAATITPADGYVLASVSITMGGKDITGTNYSDGNIYIASVTGNIVVTVSAREMTEDEKVYTITNSLVNVISNNSAVSVPGNSTYTATLTAAAGYTLDAVTVTMGGTNVTGSVYADGVIAIPAVTGNVVITATSVEGVWEAVEVTNNGSYSANWYSDDGNTLLVKTAKAFSTTPVFDTETEVKIALVLNATQYSEFYVGMTPTWAVAHYAEVFGISGYPAAGKTYERTFTVKAGYAFMVGGWSNPNNIESITVMKKG